MMLFDFILLPFLTSLIRKSAYFQNRRPLQIGEKKCILYWLSLIDLGFIICVNKKSFGHFFAIEYVVRNSLWNKYVSADNFRYVYNIFSIILLISIAKMVWKLRANTDIGQAADSKSTRQMIADHILSFFFIIGVLLTSILFPPV